MKLQSGLKPKLHCTSQCFGKHIKGWFQKIPLSLQSKSKDMKTVGTPRIICEHCNLDFTNRPYSERITHQNATSGYNIHVFARRMTGVSEDRMLYEMMDTCEVKIGTGYQTSLEIAQCVIRVLRQGMDDFDGVEKKYPKIADFVERNLPKIKSTYREIYQSTIDNIKREAEESIEEYNEMLNELPK